LSDPGIGFCFVGKIQRSLECALAIPDRDIEPGSIGFGSDFVHGHAPDMACPLPRYTTGDEIGEEWILFTRSLTHIIRMPLSATVARGNSGFCRSSVLRDCPRTQGDRHGTREEGSPRPAKKSATSALRHLAAALSDSHELPKKQAAAVLGDLATLTTRHLKKGDKIRLTGLGILQVRKCATPVAQ
jgi:hypothetical protein